MNNDTLYYSNQINGIYTENNIYIINIQINQLSYSNGRMNEITVKNIFHSLILKISNNVHTLNKI
jgi:hypothetical protein